ncbi:hypothetical protein VMUT_1343 [Vulcanisaeta moutnovskia 768-28]|uniref:Uncharacterized protein n=1 Tax=Vulcanisaeta moutnovskia (strain 768-28) TaxID=985053 RepID=F0QSN1_VULM7|nr:hypothetical protein [Vulcanisaeta moutnovskia]ADY01548.1 hypothetical protein VMUT_1343 [Vulcanisaeta moutnovskia 768-28]
MRRGLLIVGVILIIVAIVIFVVSTYVVARQVKPATMAVTLSPGDNVTVGTASLGKVLTVVYTDSINQPLETYITVPGILKTIYSNGQYVVAYTVTTGTGTLYLVNNYSVPVTIKYSIIGVSVTSSIIIAGALAFVAIIIGVVGVILAILGAVLRSRK